MSKVPTLFWSVLVVNVSDIGEANLNESNKVFLPT